MGKLAQAVNVIQTLCQAPAVEHPIKKSILCVGLRLQCPNWARGPERFRVGCTQLCRHILNKENTSVARRHLFTTRNPHKNMTVCPLKHSKFCFNDL